MSSLLVVAQPCLDYFAWKTALYLTFIYKTLIPKLLSTSQNPMWPWIKVQIQKFQGQKQDCSRVVYLNPLLRFDFNNRRNVPNLYINYTGHFFQSAWLFFSSASFYFRFRNIIIFLCFSIWEYFRQIIIKPVNIWFGNGLCKIFHSFKAVPFNEMAY